MKHRLHLRVRACVTFVGGVRMSTHFSTRLYVLVEARLARSPEFYLFFLIKKKKKGELKCLVSLKVAPGTLIAINYFKLIAKVEHRVATNVHAPILPA